MRTTTAHLACAAIVMLGPACRDSSGDAVSGDVDGTSGGDETGAEPSSTGDPVDDPDRVAGVEPLSPTARLVRASVALRGIRPSLEDLRRIDADPDAYEDLVDAYLQTPEFGATIRDLHNEALLLRTDIRPDLFYFPRNDLGIDGSIDDTQISAMVWEAPLRLVEHVVMNDRPYSEIVTADYLLANDIVARIWGLEHEGDPEAWVVTEWSDDRPRAGILSDSALFYRHKSMGTNYNRGRANQLASALLCTNFLAADIPVDGNVDLSDEDAVLDAVNNDPACVACHGPVDPIGSYLFGHDAFHLAQELGAYPLSLYDSQIEPAWMFTTERAPALFGEPGEDLADLGAQIAASPDFASCAARRFYAYLTQTRLAEVDADTVDRLTEAFEASGLDARSLAREIVLSDAFSASHSDDPALAEGVFGMQRVRPRQLDRMLEDLTGFRWYAYGLPDLDPVAGVGSSTSSTPLLANSFFGFEAIAGGLDSYYVTEASHTVNPVASLVLRQLARQAADHVVETDFARPPSERRLLSAVEPDEPDPAVVRAQIADLHLRLYGEVVDPEGPEIAGTWDLFEHALVRSQDSRHAWKVTLTAMLQDLQLIHA